MYLNDMYFIFPCIWSHSLVKIKTQFHTKISVVYLWCFSGQSLISSNLIPNNSRNSSLLSIIITLRSLTIYKGVRRLSMVVFIIV